MKAVAVLPVRGRLLRASGVAQYLGISEHRARLLIAAGELIAVRATSGRLLGVYETDCDAWIAEHRRAPQPPPPRPNGDERFVHLLPSKERIF
jgi:predicted DNA-binding transcriptional regulator AlpA